MGLKTGSFCLGLLLAVKSAFAIDVTVTLENVGAAVPRNVEVTTQDITQQILNTLVDHDVPEVYGFLAASRVETNTSLIAVLSSWVDHGYPLGNMTYGLLDLNDVGPEEFTADVQRNEFLLQELSRGMHFRYLRYPHLHEGNSREKRESVRQFLRGRSYGIAHVTVDTDDRFWVEPYYRCLAIGDLVQIDGLKTLFLQHALRQVHHARNIAARLFERDVKYVLRLTSSGFLAPVLDDLLNKIEAEFAQDRLGSAFRYVGLTEAMRDPVFAIDPGVVTERGLTFLEQVAHARGIQSPEGPRVPSELGNICR